VRRAHPSHALLFTGHSLGAQLASMAAAAAFSPPLHAPSMAPTVGFGTPAWREPLRRKTGAVPTAAAAGRHVYALADRYDPVQGLARQTGGLLGEACLWRGAPPSAACTACFADDPLRSDSRDCRVCFEQRHIYAHYLDDLLPARRPPCTPAATAPLSSTPTEAGLPLY